MKNLPRLLLGIFFAVCQILSGLTIASAQSAVPNTGQTPQRQQSADASPALSLTLLNEARNLINAGKARTAIEKLSALPNQNDVRVLHLLGMAYYELGDQERTIGLLTQVWDNLPAKSPEKREAIKTLGEAHYLAGHHADALPYLEQVLEWDADNVELNYLLGSSNLNIKQPAKARECFSRIFKSAPESAAAHLLTAQMMIRTRLFAEAETELRQAIQKDPKLPVASHLLAQLVARRMQPDEAITLLEKELAINPGNGMAYFNLGEAYCQLSKWELALLPIRKAIWLEPYFSSSYILLGKIYFQKKDLSSSVTVLKQAIQLDPNSKSAHYHLGKTYEQLGKAIEAKQEFLTSENLPGIVQWQ